MFENSINTLKKKSMCNIAPLDQLYIFKCVILEKFVL